MNNLSQTSEVGLQSEDILIGFGSADRKLLATFIALFEDSKLSKRVKGGAGELLNGLGDSWKRTTGKEFLNLQNKQGEDYLSVKSQMEYWLDEEKFTDDDLRVILWIYLRHTLQLDPVVGLSQRSLKRYATEITAATIHAFDPPELTKTVKKVLIGKSSQEDDPKIILDEIVVPVLNEMLEEAFSGEGELDTKSKEKIINDIRSNLSDLNQEDQKEILDSIGAKEFNDDAIRKVILTGGGLTVFGSAVNMAGFSAYILAAQASAFIPLVSGPALVSFVSVLSNPVTMIGGTVAAGYWANDKANKSIQSALAIRVVSMLALQGMSHRDKMGTHIRNFLKSFQRIDQIEEFGELPEKVINSFLRQWKMASKHTQNALPEIDPKLSDWTDQPIEYLYPYLKEKKDKNEELNKTSWVTGLTIGDVLYSLAAIDPKVMEAADFSRVEDIDNRLSFSEFAQEISKMSPAGSLGATSNLKGYVSEQVVASQLALQGHNIELANTSNEPGWDILVDGEKFQIKSLSSNSGIRSHFESYDYPVIANSELKEQIPSDLEDKVFFVDGFTDELVSDVTERSLSHGADMYEPDVPLIAIGVSTAFALHKYSSGKIRSDQAMEQVLLDGGTRVGLATLGGFLGSGIGLVIYGPAGALIWGGLMPILAQSQTSRVKSKVQKLAKTKEFVEWEENLEKKLDRLFGRINDNLNKKIDQLRTKYRQCGSGIASDFLKRRFADEGRYLHEMKSEIVEIRNNNSQSMEDKSIDTIRFLAHSTIHPIIYQDELIQISDVLKDKPSLTQSGSRWFKDQRSNWFS